MAGVKPGDWIVRIEAARFDAKDDDPRLIFQAPLPWLLYLAFAVDRCKRAQKLRTRALAGLRDRPDGTREPRPDRQAVAFDAISEEAASIFFSNAAIEAFANNGLGAKGGGHRFEVKKRGIVNLLTPEEVERSETLKAKLHRHLPPVLERPQLPAGVYRDFVRLERLRHAIAHAKPSDRWGSVNPGKERTMGLLLRGTVCGPRVAADILDHFIEGAVPPEIRGRVESLRGHVAD